MSHWHGSHWYGSEGAAVCDYPAVSDVRYGVVYGGGTGTLIVAALPGSSSVELSHTPGKIVQYLLVLLDLAELPVAGELKTWPVFTKEPDAPDNCITVRTTVGTDDARILTGDVDARFGFQIRVRSTTEDVGWTKMKAIRDALQTVLQETVIIDGTYYLVHAIVRIGQILPLGKQSGTKRDLFTLNAQLSVKQLT